MLGVNLIYKKTGTLQPRQVLASVLHSVPWYFLIFPWYFPDTSACLRNTLFICISDMWYKLQATGWYFDTFFWTLFLLGVAVGTNSHVDAFKSCHPTKTDNMPSLPKRGKSQPYPPEYKWSLTTSFGPFRCTKIFGRHPHLFHGQDWLSQTMPCATQ